MSANSTQTAGCRCLLMPSTGCQVTISIHKSVLNYKDLHNVTHLSEKPLLTKLDLLRQFIMQSVTENCFAQHDVAAEFTNQQELTILSYSGKRPSVCKLKTKQTITF